MMKTPDNSFKRRHYVATLLQFAVGLAVVAAGMALVSQPDSSMTRVTAERKYLIAIRPLQHSLGAEPAQHWEISLRSPSGRPVSPAQIEVDVGAESSPDGRAYFRKARVTRQLADGRYLLEGTGLGSAARQQIRLNIQAFNGADQVSFDTARAPHRRALLARTSKDVT